MIKTSVFFIAPGGENMADKLITAKYVLDTSGFNKGMTHLNAQLKASKAELKAAGAGVGAFGDKQQVAQNKVNALQKIIEQQKQKVDTYRQALEQSTQKVKDHEDKQTSLGIKLENAKDKYQELVNLYGEGSQEAQEAAKEVQNLTDRYNSNERAMIQTTQQVERYNAQISNGETELQGYETQLQEVNREIELQNNKFVQAGEKLQGYSSKLQTVGAGIASVGTGLLTVTAPLVAVGAASAKVAMDFEASMSNVKALTGATGEEFTALENKALEMGKKTSKSAKDSADALGYMALAGYDTKDMLNGLEPILRLSEAGNMDLARCSDLVTDSLSAMGLQVSDLNTYLDVCAQTQRKANTSAEGMLEAYIACGGTMKNLNIGLNESATALGVLANRGKKGSEAGNALNSIMINLTSGAGQAGVAMKKLGLNAYDSDGKFKGLKVVLSELNDKLSNCTNEQRDAYLAMIGGKTQIDTLNALLSGSQEEWDSLSASIGDSKGALNEVASTMQDNTAGELTRLKSNLESVGIKIGKVLLPKLNQLIEGAGKILDKIGELDEGTINTIANITMLTVGMGGFLKIAGGVTSTVGGIIGTVGKLSTAFGTAQVTAGAVTTTMAGVGTTAATTGATVASAGAGFAGLATSIGGAVVTAAPFIAGIAAVGVAAYAVKKKLDEEVIPEVDLFADKVETSTKVMEDGSTRIETSTVKISDSTKEAVEAYIDMDDKVKYALDDLYINSTEITKTNCKEIVSSYKEMAETIKTSLDSDKEQELQILTNFFADSKTLSKDEEAQILENTTQAYEDKKEKIDEKQQQIKEILQRAKDEHRSLTQQERIEIAQIQEGMKTDAINTLSENEVEAKVILERMKEYDGRITAEQASEHIKQLNKSRDKAIKAANEEYDKTVATIIKQRDETGTISKEQADKLIKEAKRQRDETIKKAEETRDGAVKKIKSMNKNITDSVDTSTGKILTQWDKLKRWWDSWKPGSKAFKTFVTQVNTGASYNKDKDGIRNYTGDMNFEGGLTRVMDAPVALSGDNRTYGEILDLPRGTRIYPHDATMRIAESVASSVASGILQKINISNQNQNSNKQNKYVIQLNIEKNKIGEAIIDTVEKLQGERVDLVERGLIIK